MLRYLAGGPTGEQAESAESTLLHVHMHLHSLSATLLSGAGGGGWCWGETEESAERIATCSAQCVLVPLWFLPLVPCKCRASVSLRVLAKKR